MGFWLNEKNTDGYTVNWKFTETLHTEKTDYQDLAVINTVEFGKALVLDGIIQTTEKDEFIYHEMIVHPGVMAHPVPKKVLVIGGGDGGTIREAVKYKSVEQADLVEIDEKVILASRKFLPEISSELNNNKVRIFIEDGIEFVKNKENYYDIIIIDSSDPIGPAIGLYSREFYRNVYNALKEDGLMIAQTESPLFNKELLASIYQAVSQTFPITRTYLSSIATYIGGFWSFTIGSKQYDPLSVEPDFDRIKGGELKYYNKEIHKACFALPNFIKDILK